MPRTVNGTGHFRDVKFLNNVLQQRMKPETISRAAMLRESPDCYKVAPEVIVGLYNKAHKKSKKRGAQTPAPETDESTRHRIAPLRVLSLAAGTAASLRGHRIP